MQLTNYKYDIEPLVLRNKSQKQFSRFFNLKSER